MQKIAVASLIFVSLAVPVFAGDVKRNVSSDGKSAVEVLNGETARARAAATNKREKALAKAAEMMKARGYKKTDVVTVVRSIDLRAEARRNADVSPASDTYSSDEGEVTFYAWDDGDASTWEGTIYVEKYSTGAYIVYDAQVRVDTVPTFSTIWEETVESGGGGGPGDYQYMTSLERPEPVKAASLFAAITARPDVQLVQYGGGVGGWIECFTFWCNRIIGACLWTGPYFMACAFAGCTITGIGCYINEM